MESFYRRHMFIINMIILIIIIIVNSIYFGNKNKEKESVNNEYIRFSNNSNFEKVIAIGDFYPNGKKEIEINDEAFINELWTLLKNSEEYIPENRNLFDISLRFIFYDKEGNRNIFDISKNFNKSYAYFYYNGNSNNNLRKQINDDNGIIDKLIYYIEENGTLKE